MFEKLRQKIFKKSEVGATNHAQEHGPEDRFIENALHQYGGSFALRNGSYDNTYPNIARIAEAIAEINPIAINGKGEEINLAPRLLQILARPNREMSGTDFMETLATMLLVHPKVYLLAWRNTTHGLEAGGDITLDNFAGLTFMENVAESVVDGISTYRMGGKTYSEQEVITLSLAVNPYRINDGYSPSIASKKWPTTDDFIAEYHNAQFRNGAVPAGQFTITAPSVAIYNDIVDRMQEQFRGARKAGNIMYVHRPTSSIDGKPEAAAIEWTPFAQTNKELTLEAVYNQANHKIDTIFGVPEEIKGHLSNSNYASAEVADYVFARRVVYPKLVKIYSRLTHEFNRIFGGMGFALSFNYELPMLTDTRKLQAEALKTMIEAGFTHESAVEALRLPESFRQLEMRKGLAQGAKRSGAPELRRIASETDCLQADFRATHAESGEAANAEKASNGDAQGAATCALRQRKPCERVRQRGAK